MLSLLIAFVFITDWLLILHFIQRNHELSDRYIKRLEDEDGRAYEIGRQGIEGELGALREGIDRERDLIADYKEREEAILDRYLDKKNIAPLKDLPKEPPPPLTQTWNEQDLAYYRSWASEEKLIATQSGQPTPSDSQLEGLYRMTFGSARPSEVF